MKDQKNEEAVVKNRATKQFWFSKTNLQTHAMHASTCRWKTLTTDSWENLKTIDKIKCIALCGQTIKLNPDSIVTIFLY